jgi:hypothetical protein
MIKSLNIDQLEQPGKLFSNIYFLLEVEVDPYENLKESRVSKRLSDLTTKRVIIIVLLLLLVMPLFSADYYFDPPKTMDFSLTLLKDISEVDRSTFINYKSSILPRLK